MWATGAAEAQAAFESAAGSLPYLTKGTAMEALVSLGLNQVIDDTILMLLLKNYSSEYNHRQVKIGALTIVFRASGG
jgi:hypothetical protein